MLFYKNDCYIFSPEFVKNCLLSIQDKDKVTILLKDQNSFVPSYILRSDDSIKTRITKENNIIKIYIYKLLEDSFGMSIGSPNGFRITNTKTIFSIKIPVELYNKIHNIFEDNDRSKFGYTLFHNLATKIITKEQIKYFINTKEAISLKNNMSLDSPLHIFFRSINFYLSNSINQKDNFGELDQEKKEISSPIYLPDINEIKKEYEKEVIKEWGSLESFFDFIFSTISENKNSFIFDRNIFNETPFQLLLSNNIRTGNDRKLIGDIIKKYFPIVQLNIQDDYIYTNAINEFYKKLTPSDLLLAEIE